MAFSHDNAKREDWARLNVTGPHGLFVVVVSTSWWAVFPNLGAEFDTAVEDLHWVIEMLMFFNSQSTAAQVGSKWAQKTSSLFMVSGHLESAKLNPPPKSVIKHS